MSYLRRPRQQDRRAHCRPLRRVLGIGVRQHTGGEQAVGVAGGGRRFSYGNVAREPGERER